MNNKYYDPFSVLTKTQINREKKLFDKNEKSDKSKLYIVKSSNNEKILINKAIFKIGIKKELCDYIVTDSKYVGRYHATIITKNGQAFFEDNNSTNKSYINHVQAMPSQKILLKNGDEIKLANVLFKFIQE